MATEYVVRDTAGSVRNGAFPEGDPATIYVAFSRDVSLNLDQSEVASYTRTGNDLTVTLTNGQVLVLDGYFEEASTGPKNLFLSEQGELVEVFLGDAQEGAIIADYANLDVSGKWSSYDDLVFLDLGEVEPVLAPLAAPVLGGLGIGPLAGGAALAGAALLGGGGGDDTTTGGGADTTTGGGDDTTTGGGDDTTTGGGNDTTTGGGDDTTSGGGDDTTTGGGGDDTVSGGDGSTLVRPTVDAVDTTQLIGGDEDGAPVVTGTGVPGTEVTVVIDDKTVTTTVGTDGKWSADFSGDNLPDDGVWDTTVTAKDSDGKVETLDGPTVDIDTTAPIVDVTDGTKSTGDFVNSLTHTTGTTITGTGEAGADVDVTIQGTTHSVVVGSDGSWSVTFAESEIRAGEYDDNIVITTSDDRGNTRTYTETLVVDTVQTVTMNASINGDYIINAAEQTAGVTFTGTAQAGSDVQVKLGEATTTVKADASGNWSATFTSSDIKTGTYDTKVTATATDAYGNTATTSKDISVDTQIAVAVDKGQAGGDDIINSAEASSDITLTGTAEVGSAVVVTVEGVTRKATVDKDGDWTVTFEAGSIRAGEYDTKITAVAVDKAGNSATSTADIRVDTVAGEVALSPEPIEIDDVINAVERQDGVEISGTATAGLTVTVKLGDATTTVVADSAGKWSTTFAKSEVPEGTKSLDISASITDAAGNSKTVTDTVGLDTEVVPLTQSAGKIEGDDVINSVERADGVVLTGTVEVGSTVAVTMGKSTVNATVDASGNWSATFPAGSIPDGTYDADITIKATDAAGNVAEITDTVKVDTVAGLTSEPKQTADDIVNAAELATGVTLEGTTDPGSTVKVELQGKTRDATVDAKGNWQVTFPASDLPDGTYAATAKITAVDTAGNTATVNESFKVDTMVDTPDLDSVTFTGGDVRRISTEDAVDSYVVNTLETGGTVGAPTAAVSSDPTFGTELTFATPISDGTNLVITRTDDAGNSASTVVVLEDDATSTSTLGHAGIKDFDIAALNLDYGDDANLVLTEAQIRSLSDGTDTLTIHGGSDDTVTVTGAKDTGKTQTIEGQTYNVYTIGDDGATLVIEQNVNVVI